MHIQLQTLPGTPGWNDGREQRLFVSMLLATLFVAGVLSVIRAPVMPAWSPVVELLVRIVQESPAAEPEALPEQPPVATPSPDAGERAVEAPPTMGRDALQESEPGTDWDSARDKAVQEYVDSQIETYGYFNPDLADKRRRLSERYQPRTHPGPKPIWENIEKDTLGRSVLRYGDCFKVLDDPNVGRRDAFEMFDQYMVVCTYQRRNPKNLPWVADIVQRYEYLRDPDGYVKGEE